MAGTFTYTFDPANNKVDWVRMSLQDTEEDEVLLFDEEINYFLGLYPDRPWKVLAEAARAIYIRLSRAPLRERAGNYEVQGRSINDYLDLITYWEEKDGVRTKAPIPHYGGVDCRDTFRNRNDASINQPSFYRGAPGYVRGFDDEWFNY